MKKHQLFKKVLVGLMGLVLLTGCGNETKNSEPLKIAALNGPTGMGMVQLLEEDSKAYDITIYQSADEVVGKIISNEIDIACVPSNMGAILYNKTEHNINLLGVNTLGVLYILENGNLITSLEDLKGKTLVASGKGGTPEYVLNYLLISAGIDPEVDMNIEYLANHTDVVTRLISEPGNIALLPEPHVTLAKSKADSVQIALDLNEAWKQQEGSNLPMGVIVAQKDLVDHHQKELESFLKDYEASVKFVNEKSDEAAVLMEKHSILAKKEIALSAIANCQIVFKIGEEAKAELEPFFTILQEFNLQAIGGTMPDEAFYYHQ